MECLNGECDIETCINTIRSINEQNETMIKQLVTENKALKTEHYKDEKVKQLTEQLDEMRNAYYRGFPISEEEQDKIETWKMEHERTVHGLISREERLFAGGVSGGRYTYEFVPTYLGVVGTVICNCGARYTFQELG